MNVQELVTLLTNNKNKMLKGDQLQSMLQKELGVKKYLSIKDKKQLVEDIVNECILYEDGVYKFDDIEKYICFIMRTIEAYTNIELSDDIEDDYDMLCSAGILDVIIGTFKKEYDEVNILLQMKCEYILSENSIEAQVGKFLDSILSKVDDLVVALSNGVQNLDKLPVEKEDLIKLLDFVNAHK